MTYSIAGLPPEDFAPLFALPDDHLAVRGARLVVADTDRGYPCRVSLQDARAGERLLLVNHASNAGPGPYRSTFAIFVREGARPVRHVDSLPPVFAGRPLSFRGYDAAGDLVAARLSPSDDGHDAAIRELLADHRIDHLDAHNAAYGCFAARVERYRSEA